MFTSTIRYYFVLIRFSFPFVVVALTSLLRSLTQILRIISEYEAPYKALLGRRAPYELAQPFWD